MAATIPLPTPAFNRNFDWIVQNFDDLSNQFPNQWIAVDQCRVLAADPGLDVVKKGATNSGTPGDTVYFFVDDGLLIFGIS